MDGEMITPRRVLLAGLAVTGALGAAALLLLSIGMTGYNVDDGSWGNESMATATATVTDVEPPDVDVAFQHEGTGVNAVLDWADPPPDLGPGDRVEIAFRPTDPRYTVVPAETVPGAGERTGPVHGWALRVSAGVALAAVLALVLTLAGALRARAVHPARP